MVDQLDINLIVQRLTDEGCKNISLDNSSILCDVEILGETLALTCELTDTFPYEFPIVRLTEESYNRISPLPHVDFETGICTFDKQICFPNWKAPESIIADSIKKAQLILQEGLTGSNTEDYIDEFGSYWAVEAVGVVESICEFGDLPSVFCIYYPRDEDKAYLGNTKEDLDAYLNKVGIKKRYLKDYYECLYLPLSIPIFPPFPKTNLEMYNLLQADPVISSFYNKELKKRLPQPIFVSFSIKNERRYLQLFLHTKVDPGYNGFRRGHMPACVAYARDSLKNPIYKLCIDDMRQQRIFTRGGSGVTDTINKIAILGCGSVGGYLSEALSERGVSSFVLVDNEKLGSENIARHLCGHKYIGKDKVLAIKDKLCKHNPNVEIVTYQQNAFNFVEKHVDVLNSCDLIFLATANVPLEYKIMQLVQENMIHKPVVMLWVEPYIAAGHALIIQKPQDVFEELFTEEFDFKYNILKNGEMFSKKESGCQSTYIPYGAFELKRYIYDFLGYYFGEVVKKEKQGNYHYMWSGDIEYVKSLGGCIADIWKTVNCYNRNIKRID